MRRIGRHGMDRLSTGQLLAFGFPAFTHAMVAGPVYTILPTFYAANTAVSLAQIGTIAGVSRIVDALNDPLMGYLSDKTQSRFGSRKPWIAASILFCVVAVFFLFTPGPGATWLYFFIWAQILYTGFTMFEVPRAAWGAELSRDYNERATIGLYVGAFNICGSLAFFLLPVAMGLLIGNSEIDAGTLRITAIAYAVLMPLGVLLSLLLVPQGHKVDHRKLRMRDFLRTIRQSRPAQLFFSCTLLWGLGQGIVIACVYIFYGVYMKLGGNFAMIMGALYLVQVLSLPLWSRILPRFDRNRVWAACIGAAALIAPVVLLLPRGEGALIPVLGLVLIQGFLTAPTNFLPGAILGDVIDHDVLKTGSNKAGNLFAVQMLLIKIAMAVGGAVAFNLLDLAGYDVKRENSAAAETGLVLIFVGMPILFHLAAAIIAWNFPITRRNQRIIHDRLERRRQRQLAAAGD